MEDDFLEIFPGIDRIPDSINPDATKQSEDVPKPQPENLVHTEEVPDVTRTPGPLELTPSTPSTSQAHSHTEIIKRTPETTYNDMTSNAANTHTFVQPPLPSTILDPSKPPMSTDAMLPAQLLNETQAFISKLQALVSSVSSEFMMTGQQPDSVGPYSQPTNPGFIPIRVNTIRQFQTRERLREQRIEKDTQVPVSHPPNTLAEIPAEKHEATVPEDVSSQLLFGGVRDSQMRRVITQQEKEELLTEGHKPPQYSKSVQAQNKKVSDIYDNFISQMEELAAYPISSVAAVSFLTWLERSKRFCPKSIDDVVWPSLCRLNILHAHEHINPYTQSCARAKIAEIYRSPDAKKSRGGMQPLIPDDIARIIKALPKQSSTTAKLASLFLFAICTGARGDSCSHVRLCDFLGLIKNEKGAYLVGVRLVKLKSRPGEHLDLTLAGQLEKESPMDVLFWLDRYLRQQFKISLVELCSSERQRPAEFYQQRMWPISTDSMTVALKESMRSAGFNPSHYGFHSFRSGFLTTVLSVTRAKGGSFHDSMTIAALITGWTAFGAIHFNYFKQPARRNLITTNLIGITDTPSHQRQPSFTPPSSLANQTEAGEYIIQSSLDFHHLDQITPRPNHRSFAFEVKRLLAKKLRIPSANELANYNYITNSYCWCLREFALREIRKNPSDIDPLTPLQSLSSLRNKGMKLVDQRLQADPDCGPTIAEEMYSMLKAKDKLKTELPTEYYRTTYICRGPARPTITTKGNKERRVRREWSEAEEKIFQAGVTSHKTAREIADELYIRTPEDVRYHLRAENKKRAERNPPDPPLSLAKSRRSRKRESPSPSPTTPKPESPSPDPDSESSSEIETDLFPFFDSDESNSTSAEADG